MRSTPIRTSRPAPRSAALAAVLALAAACAGGGLTPPPDDAVTSLEGPYVIGAGDTLQVRVWRNPELTVAEVPVRPDGMISVPLIDDVRAAGLTADELKEVVTRELSEYVDNPDVTVVVVSMGSKRVYVLGEVGRSGPIPLSTVTRVTDAISSAGGFTPFADKGDVKIIRRTQDGEVEYRFDYGAYIKGKAPGTNMVLLPGDTVVVSD